MEKTKENVAVHIKGIKPLLMHAANSIGQASTKKTNNYDPQEEAESALHKDSNGVIGIPSIAIVQCMKKAATEHKAPGRGKKTLKDFVLSGLLIHDEFIPLIPQDWKIDSRPAVVQRARIMRWRPRFDTWELKFDIEISDPSIWSPSLIKTILFDAGKYVGLLDFRPLFGTFEVVSVTYNGKEIR